MHPPRRRQRAFTLVELMVTIAIIAVLLAIAAPQFRPMIEMQRLRGSHDQLSTDIQFARSEAARLRMPVHVRVQPSSSSGPACYILFSDAGQANSTFSFSAACDCKQPAGSRCSAAATAEIKTVSLEAFTGVDLQNINLDQVGFDPANGMVLVKPDDSGNPLPPEFMVDVKLDAARRLRTSVTYSGKVRNCAPAGSTVKAIAC